VNASRSARLDQLQNLRPETASPTFTIKRLQDGLRRGGDITRLGTDPGLLQQRGGLLDERTAIGMITR